MDGSLGVLRASLSCLRTVKEWVKASPTSERCLGAWEGRLLVNDWALSGPHRFRLVTIDCCRP